MAQTLQLRTRWLYERLPFATFRFFTLGRALPGTFSCGILLVISRRNGGTWVLILRCSARINALNAIRCVVLRQPSTHGLGPIPGDKGLELIVVLSLLHRFFSSTLYGRTVCTLSNDNDSRNIFDRDITKKYYSIIPWLARG